MARHARIQPSVRSVVGVPRPSDWHVPRLPLIRSLVFPMSHFLFIAAALRERSSQDSAELQLGAGIWGLCTTLIRDNLQKFLTPESHGFVYVLKEGICAEFAIASPVLPAQALDDFLKDEVRTEARYGFVRITPVRRWHGHASGMPDFVATSVGYQGGYRTNPAAESGNASFGSRGVPGNSRRVGSWRVTGP